MNDELLTRMMPALVAQMDAEMMAHSDRWRVDGIERTCTECGEPLMVRRHEAGQYDVFHEHCLEAIRERHLARRQQMSGDAA